MLGLRGLRRRNDYCPHRFLRFGGGYGCSKRKSEVCPNPTYPISRCTTVNLLGERLVRTQNTT